MINDNNNVIIAPDSLAAATSQQNPILINDCSLEVPATPIQNVQTAAPDDTPTPDLSMLDPDADPFLHIRSDVFNVSPAHSSDFSSPIQNNLGGTPLHDSCDSSAAALHVATLGPSSANASTPYNNTSQQVSSDILAADNSETNDTVRLDLSPSSRGSLSSGFTPSDRGPAPSHINRNRLKRIDVSNVRTCPTGHSVVGDMLNLVFPVIGTWKCPLINCTSNYGGDPWTTAQQ